MRRCRASTYGRRERGREIAFRPRVESVERRRLLTNFVVTSTNDSGLGTLRQAITAANANPGPDTISFQFPPENEPGLVDYDRTFQVWRIHVDSQLPAITDEVQIDGYSQRVITGRSPVNEIQDISLTGLPTGGTFRLTFEGETTGPIPYNATADQVAAALEGLPNVGQGNINATLGPVNTGLVSITFQAALGETDVGQITGDASGLISPPGLTPGVFASTLANGVSGDITSDQNALTVGFNAKVRVILEGGVGGTQASFPGLTIQSDHNIIRGLSIDGFSAGIAVQGPSAIGNQIQGNYLGAYVLFPNPILNAGTSTVQGIGNGVGIAVASPTNNAVGGVAPETHNGIAGNAAQGVWVEPGADGNLVTGNLIGVLEQDANFYYQIGNGAEGVLVQAANGLIGGATAGATNVISANDSYGVHLVGPTATRNRIVGNYIGTDINGTFRFGQGFPGNGQTPPTSDGNARDGVFIDNAPDNQVGIPGGSGGDNGGGNVVSGNFGDGVRVAGAAATGNAVQGNVIGLNLGGTSALPNAQAGVRIESAGNTVGGATSAASNTISGNRVGVLLSGTAATGNLVAGNRIGTDATGSYDLGNAQEGIRVDGAPSNTIGGTNPAALNLISGNNVGVAVVGAAATGNAIQGNAIGTDATGAQPLGNAVDGVLLSDSATRNLIGGPDVAEGNAIAYNARDGVRVETPGSTSNGILSNSIFSNGLGIDLVTPSGPPSGVTANTPGGPHVGPNNLQNFPVLALASSNVSTSTTVAGGLNSTPNTTFLIQFFTDAVLNPSGFGEGQTLLGPTAVTTDGAGNAAFTVSFPTAIAAGHFITATATDPGNNTSEFSAGIPVQSLPGALEFSSPSYSIGESAGTATITVTRAAGSSGTVSVDYSTGNPAPGTPPDYLPTAGTLTFHDGETLKTFTVTILADGRFEPDQAVPLILSHPTGGASLGAPSTATLTIHNKDAPRFGSFQFSMATYQVAGGAGTGLITVERTGGADGTATVNFATSNGTAIKGIDYTAESGTLVFASGETSKSFTVPVLDQSPVVGSRTIVLSLFDPTGGATLSAPATATLTIQDVSGPTVRAVRLVTNRRRLATGLVVTFSEPVSAETATNLLNYGYAVQTQGRDHGFGTRGSRLIPIRTAVYDPATLSLTLGFGSGIRRATSFRFAINESTGVPGAGVGVSDLAGNLLDGNADGVAGGPYVAVLSGRAGGNIAPRAAAARLPELRSARRWDARPGRARP